MDDATGLVSGACSQPTTWTSTAGRQAFRPGVEVAQRSSGRAVWYVTYTADTGAQDGRAHLEARSFGPGFSRLRQVTRDEIVCTDLRGRWGEYDEMVVVNNGSAQPIFSRPFPSAQGVSACTLRTGYQRAPVHVDVLRFVPIEFR